MIGRPRRSTLFPYPTLFGSGAGAGNRAPHAAERGRNAGQRDRGPRQGRRWRAADRGGGELPPPPRDDRGPGHPRRSEEHTSELQSQSNIVCRLLLEKKKKFI